MDKLPADPNFKDVNAYFVQEIFLDELHPHHLTIANKSDGVGEQSECERVLQGAVVKAE